MATTTLLATMNAVKLHGVSFFSGKPDHYLARRASQTTRRIHTSCCYRETSLKSGTSFMVPEPKTETKSDSDGIGILRFLKGKTYLITGATGFLAKVLIEKLMRASPEIGKIFILIKYEDQESANKRLYDEIITSDLFKFIKQMHGTSYETFMKSKLIPVVGNIGEDNLGIKSEIADKISDEIDVIINCAGLTTFDNRYDSSLRVNVLGPGRLLSFGKECKKLKLFLHFSTAYVTGKKEGTILETPLCIGENITSHISIKTEMKLVSEALRKFSGREEIKKLKELGMERAQHHGWENTYTFTKAIGEYVIHNQRGDLPVVIIRLSIIESSYKEPFPGWLQGIRMSTPVILAYGKDQVADWWGDYQSPCDIIHVDMVANTAIVAMAKHGCGVSELKVYNVTSSAHANPLRLGELMDFSQQHLRDSPLTETMMELERMKFHSSLDDFTSSVSNKIAKQEGEMSMKGRRKLEYFVSLARIYQPYTFF